MDETINLMFEGCKMAKFLEGNLLNMANQPQLLISSCDEIIRVFSKAKEDISKAQLVVLSEPHASQQLEIGAGVQEWLKYNRSQAMDLLHAQHLLLADAKMKGVGGGGLEEMVVRQMGGGGGGGHISLESGREILPPAAEAASSGGGRASSSSQRPRRRGQGGNRRVHREAAPQMGNTESPPEDGYTWRKYGQKSILHSRFPRSYFRCTHQKLYQCPAKKQVQRLDNDPNIFEVTYMGDHTCHLSSTAPSVPVQPSVELRQQGHTIIQQATSAAVHPLPTTVTPTAPMSQWLSMDISTHRDFGLAVAGGAGGGGSTSNNINLASGTSSGAAAGPSTSRYGRDAGDYQLPVTYLADAMFNSGSSSNNSMDLIFSSMDHDKWPDSGDKKN